MADNSKAGSDWTDDELDAIVVDYFAMLTHELAGQIYVKSHHARDLMKQFGRSHGSIEFKHRNISAVMSKLGCPIIKGYLPAFNFQDAIYDAIDRHLTQYPKALDLAGVPSPAVSEPFALYEEAAPILRPAKVDQAPRMQALVRKFDPSLRDFRNRALGEAGERLVFDTEIARLNKLGCLALAKDVRWIDEPSGGYIEQYFPLDAAIHRQLI